MGSQVMLCTGATPWRDLRQRGPAGAVPAPVPPGAARERRAPPPPPSLSPRRAPRRVGPAIVLAAWRPGDVDPAPGGGPAVGAGGGPGAGRADAPGGAAGGDRVPDAEAADAGIDPLEAAQRARLDAGYAAAERGDDGAARRAFAEAARGPRRELARQALRELNESWLDEAYRRKARGDLHGAWEAFAAAAAAGADPQTVESELGYLAVQRGRPTEAARHLRTAATGPDRTLAGDADEALAALPRHLTSEVYLEAFGWRRAQGAARGRYLVPFAQLTLRWRPDLARDVSLYARLDLARDFGGGAPVGGVPPSYADGMVAAVGVLYRAWQERLDLFAQAGSATRLSPTAGDLQQGATRLDLRAGATLGLETDGCWPRPAHGVELGWRPCADAWWEASVLHRDHDDGGTFLRGRLGASLLFTGPVAWGVVAEGRSGLDVHGEIYGQFVDAGAGLRARLLAPIHVDVVATVNRGRILGVAKPTPDPATYTDLRLLLVTSYERSP
ncbi:hypothetical protein [Anaeromyxobacter sp. K]|uniref:hypothetical protein n=1 Tax=Anaeromyxobacter sp. (strain K) TaxID=447217 RepID=UPI001E36C8A9|nr:hypothetical protein [Anaeromyxobacter sp. K]